MRQAGWWLAHGFGCLATGLAVVATDDGHECDYDHAKAYENVVRCPDGQLGCSASPMCLLLSIVIRSKPQILRTAHVGYLARPDLRLDHLNRMLMRFQSDVILVMDKTHHKTRCPPP